MKIYLATPMTDTTMQEWKASKEKFISNKELKENLEKVGHTVFLPQECDQHNLQEVFERELQEIEDSDAVVAVLSDTRGVYCEIGYAYAISKPIYGLEVEGMRAMSAWGENWFVSVSKNLEELLDSLP